MTKKPQTRNRKVLNTYCVSALTVDSAAIAGSTSANETTKVNKILPKFFITSPFFVIRLFILNYYQLDLIRFECSYEIFAWNISHAIFA